MRFPGTILLCAFCLCVSLQRVDGQVAGLHRELYFNLSREGFSLARLTNHPNFLAGRPDQTNIVTSGFQTEAQRGDDYGQRLRGWITAPTTGNYTFWISSDETSNLYLGTNEDPATKQLIAWVDPRSQPGNYSTHHGQQSAPVALQAGRRYYVEVVHHEVNLIDHLSVQWRLPAGTMESPIPNTRLVYEIAPLITADLTNVTVEEGRPVAFVPKLANFLPQSFRWQKNGADIPGATNRTYGIDAVNLADNGGLFRAFITNRVGMTNTAEAQLTVLRDTNAPAVVEVVSANANTLFVTFSEPVAASALDGSHYTLPGRTMTGVQFGSDARTVVLTLSPPVPFETSQTLRVSNVLDRASTPNVLVGTQVVFTAREFNLQTVGGAASGGIVPVTGGGNVTGWGAGEDQFQFGWQSVVGNFDYQVRVQELSLADVWARAGLMARENLGTESPFAAAFATPTLAGSFFQYRTNQGGLTARVGSRPASFPNMWLRLQRAGDVFRGFASQDGENWVQLGSVTMSLSNRLYLGLAASGHSTNLPVVAQFRNFSAVSGGAIVAATPRTEPLGPSSRKTGLVISEIMYHPRDAFFSGTNKYELEFVELFNSNPYFEDVSGYRLSGDIDYVFPPGTVIKGGAFLVVARVPAHVESFYNVQSVLGPFTNNLPNNGGRIRLRNNNDFVLLEVNYESGSPWPIAADGAGHSLVLARPSYGEGHRAAWAASDSIGGSPGTLEPVSLESLRNVMINEFLAHTDAPLVDFIELYNHSAQPVDVGGAWLTDNPATNKFKIPSPTIIQPRGFVSFNQTQLGFSLSSAGERILLVNSNQTRIIDALDFGPQANGISYGRYPDGAPLFQELQQTTGGATNTPPRAREIVINEIMYHPISENSDDEYLELVNRGVTVVNLGGWRFTEGITFRIPTNTMIAPGGFLVVARNRTNLLARYPNLAANPSLVVGDYDGNLANDGERIALARPELAINADDPQNVTTNIIYVVVDELEYRDGGSWGHWSDGGGSSLELIDSRADNRLAPNWADSDETAKASWSTIEHTGLLDNGGDTPDHLHVIMLEEGECLVDDVEVIPQGAANRISNSTFETGLTGWTARGDHERSSLASIGYNSSRSLHVRASARGDIGPNKIRVPFTSAMTAGQTATIRAKVRWLRGWPEILFRVRGSYLEATDRMAVPTNLGTPGTINSRAGANAGPAITDVTHTPVVPAANQAIVVSARVSDIDGVPSVVARYRIDPGTNLTEAAMNDSGLNGDAFAGDGIFSATIPGQPSNVIVAFAVHASDGGLLGGTSRYPPLRDDNGPVRECLVHFGSPIPSGSFGTYRFWITQQSITNWSQREVLSNERIPGAFVYGNHRVIYQSGSRYSGSAAHQDQAAPDYSPIGTPNNYTFDMPKDELLLGTDNFNKVHGPGNNHHDDNTLSREATAYWMAQELGLPANYKRFVAMYINGARRGALMEDTQVPNTEVIASVFPDDSEGDLHKISVWYEFGSVNSPQALPYTGISEAYLNNYATTGGAKKRARYRWNWQPRAVHGTGNDFTNLFLLVDAANTPAGSAFVQRMDAIVNVENWMRTFALEHAVGNWDSFGYRNEQNMFAYKPERGRWSLLIWDINIIFGGGTRGTPIGTNETLFEIDTADLPMNTLYNTPIYRRAYLRALKEIADGVFVNANADPLMDARFQAFQDSGVYVTAPNLIKTWISQRRSYVLSELTRLDPPNFIVTTPGTFTSATNLIAISGVAPIRVHSVRVNGIAWPVTWTSVTNWTMRVPLEQAANNLVIVGYDARGVPIGGTSNVLTVTYNGPTPRPEDHLLINEIVYNPATPGAGFVEILNSSPTFTFDLSGWRVNGLDFTFPPGAIITNRQMLVLAQNRTAFAQTYGVSNAVFAEFDGTLDLDGETLSLIKPGPAEDEDITIDRVRYEPRAPWPDASGSGSLQLIDAAQDNARVSNWSDGSGWKFFSYTGNLNPGTNQFRLFLNATGQIYIDDLALFPGLADPGGPRLIRGGGFEGPLLTNDGGPWSFSHPSLSNTVITTEANHSGASALKLVHQLAGPTAFLAQNDLVISNAGQYTLRFWYLPITNNTTLTVSFSANSSFRPIANVRISPGTPGGANAGTAPLPPYDLLWLNELQAQNTVGIADNFGEREPWIELFNASGNSLDLSGYFLANNYDTNLTQWAFPSGASIGPGEFKIIWADGEASETLGNAWHTSFRLNSATGSVALVRIVDGQPQITDYLTYANLGPALSYGDWPDGQPFARRIFQSVTPGATNFARTASVFINEWMASNTETLRDPSDQSFDDWFELYNAGSEPVDLGGYWLADSIVNPNGGFQIPTNGSYVIAPGGFLLVWADEDSSDNNAASPDLHVNFRLSAGQDQIGLFAPDFTPVDRVSFTNHLSNISEGRFADGASAIYVMTNPTPRAPNMVGGANLPPQIAPIQNRIVTLGQTLNFTVAATDPEGQALSFSLQGAVPAGAQITTLSGLFSWGPTQQQTPSTNVITVRATDNGVPPMSATRAFTVIVAPPPQLTGITPLSAGSLSLTWSTIPGKTYRVEYRNDLHAGPWQPLGAERTAVGTSLTIIDNIGLQPQRFYRITILD
jgi:hypothetical protein